VAKITSSQACINIALIEIRRTINAFKYQYTNAE